MPNYKLIYFGIPGRAEIARFLFHYGGIKFEDFRFGFDQWPAFKKDTPFEQVPVLEIDGVKCFQSMAIARYIANEVKLTGNNSLENLQIDTMVDTLSDFLEKAVKYAFHEKDENRKKDLYKDIIETAAPLYLGKLDAIAKANGGYIALGKLTWADIFLVVVMENTTNYLNQKVWEKYENLQQVKKKVLTNPNLREYIKNRPINPMATLYDLKEDL